MSTSRRISLTASLALASAGLASAMALLVLPAGAVDPGQALEVVGQGFAPKNGPMSCPVPLDINCGRPSLT